MKSCDWEGIEGGCLGYLTITSIPHNERTSNIFRFFELPGKTLRNSANICRTDLKVEHILKVEQK